MVLQPRIYIQRLLETKDSYSYDYMGASEFESGSCLLPRAELANPDCFIHRNIVFDTGAVKRPVLIRVPRQYNADAGKRDRLFELLYNLQSQDTYNSAEVIEYKYSKPNPSKRNTAWMMIHPIPMLLYEEVYGPRVDAWLKEFRDNICIKLKSATFDICLNEIRENSKPRILPFKF